MVVVDTSVLFATESKDEGGGSLRFKWNINGLRIERDGGLYENIFNRADEFNQKRVKILSLLHLHSSRKSMLNTLQSANNPKQWIRPEQKKRYSSWLTLMNRWFFPLIPTEENCSLNSPMYSFSLFRMGIKLDWIPWFGYSFVLLHSPNEVADVEQNEEHSKDLYIVLKGKGEQSVS